ncbi:MazG-like nucleotide pyrophosphohydrolase [Microbacterium phage Lucky3]|uniref:MazG-like nucleotide pyrophosphohydrolase n=2 Tax=Kojivirus golden TaxID=2560590 RepID=A0A2P1CFZ2_9CAUD|nr:nucleotide pyrophosphohydrolase [Microbacterium phage Golden]AVJ49789.1 MazG-like nucleotide pyrophosphohydrolase [Microbacterium phage Golden]AVJ50099.1 MazG-like nucleotide pyrophosphohydrolase [Microbacterium phage Lucky3]WNM68015.1 MazG-like nucleotide pyrophosphohydrolase [Microbacterium phage SirVictor]WNM74386.1 MazG-like nucleotide pyrophosphohydrolase [Microbacterium phage Guetzie]
MNTTKENTVTEYQLKTSTVEAQRFDVARVDDIAKWCQGNKVQSSSDGWWIVLGKHTAVPGDYIAKLPDGTFTPYPAEQFEAQYQPVGSTGDGDYVLARSRDYTVELGGQVFTGEQWEVISTYAKGHALSAVQDATRINPMQAAVVEFQRAMDLPVLSVATPLPEERVPLRVQLIEEEFQELQDALAVGDLVETADACVDLLYVVFGLMVETGLDARVLFDEVHRSNMSKFGEDGKAIIAGPNDPDGIFEGRVKKGPNYFRPNLAGIIANDMAHLEA